MAEDNGKQTEEEKSVESDEEIDKFDLSFMTDALDTEGMSDEEKMKVGRVDGFDDEPVIDENHPEFWKGQSIAETIELAKERDRLVLEGKIRPFEGALSDEEREAKRVENEAQFKADKEAGLTPEERETRRLEAEDRLSDEDKEKLRLEQVEKDKKAEKDKEKKAAEFKYIDPAEEVDADEATKKAAAADAEKEKQRLAEEAKAREDPFIKTDEDKAFVDGLHEDDAELLEMARFAEGFNKDKYKGRFAQTLRFLKDKGAMEKKHSEENPDEPAEDSQVLQDWISKNEPKMGRAEGRKLNKEMFISETLERGRAQTDDALANATEEIERLKSQPVAQQAVADYYKEASTVIPQDIREVYQKALEEGKDNVGAAAAIEETFGQEAQIAARAWETAKALGSEFINMTKGVTGVDLLNPVHAEINLRITRFGKEIAARSEDPEKAKTLILDDGRTFVVRSKFIKMEKAERVKHWSLSDTQILKLFVQQETRRASEQIDKIRTAKYEHEITFAKTHGVDVSKIAKPKLSTDKAVTKKVAKKVAAKAKAPKPSSNTTDDDDVSPKVAPGRESGDHAENRNETASTGLGEYMLPGMTHDTTPKE